MAGVSRAAQPAARALRVRSRSPSFWRAGRMFSRDPVVLPLDSLDELQIQAIREEPMLLVEEVELSP